MYTCTCIYNTWCVGSKNETLCILEIQFKVKCIQKDIQNVHVHVCNKVTEGESSDIWLSVLETLKLDVGFKK